MQEYHVIGIMSGTSLDGVDLAYCHFKLEAGQWKFDILHAQTIPYDNAWKECLSSLENKSALELAQTHADYGHFLGKEVHKFIAENKLSPVNIIASHGHTIFHQPEKRMTCQIGDGASITSEATLPVVCDFRSGDVALGGQGAPLVPIGDRLLFAEYDACLNLGGFANISFEHQNKRIAFDICPVNIIINHLSQQLGKDFDKGGQLAKRGNVHDELLQQLHAIEFYHRGKNIPKSMGKEYVLEVFHPILNAFDITVEDKLRTYYQHVAEQIKLAFPEKANAKMLVTGGGAFNDFLIELMQKNSDCEIIVPDKTTVNFKEALLFAFLGVLRMRNEVNCLASVTGASRDSIGGTVYRTN